jgi:glycogen phosphorylase
VISVVDDLAGRVAYFSMEIGIDDSIPTFSGGLGILAGDYLKSAADLGKPLVGVTILYNMGYFTQKIENGRQVEKYEHYDPRELMREVPEKVKVQIEGRDVLVRAWQYDLKGSTGKTIPILFLDTHCNGNRPWDEDITKNLYGGNHPYHRITQEVVLGVGGTRMLQALGYKPEVYHINEGHGAFLTLELASQLGSKDKAKEKCVFTTHTPVPAGHDRFSYDLAYQVLGNYLPSNIREMAGNYELNMTNLALSLSRYGNGVAKKHGEVARRMLNRKDIDSITNGVHSYTWTAKPMQAVFDEFIPEWRTDPIALAESGRIPDSALLMAHEESKEQMIDYVNTHNVLRAKFDPEIPTIGFARRFATYKRGNMALADLQRFVDIAGGRAQLVYAGKAHPQDGGGHAIIEDLLRAASSLDGKVSVAFLPNYNMGIGALLTSGSDVWLNNPRKPEEASGTSGMKAAHNGNPHFSTNDGWWYEVPRLGDRKQGGWLIGTEDETSDWNLESQDLYRKLDKEVIPVLNDPKAHSEMMRESIKNASYFNTHRMIKDYFDKAY